MMIALSIATSVLFGSLGGWFGYLCCVGLSYSETRSQKLEAIGALVPAAGAVLNAIAPWTGHFVLFFILFLIGNGLLVLGRAMFEVVVFSSGTTAPTETKGKDSR